MELVTKNKTLIQIIKFALDTSCYYQKNDHNIPIRFFSAPDKKDTSALPTFSSLISISPINVSMALLNDLNRLLPSLKGFAIWHIVISDIRSL
ncbi:hypothetical protein [Peribacillus sp. NPDC096540]|uniref:hypothetical protein n=1 Tax=Peribacillus sp. NPDC096540 TaxID=3390612 RepID=UPI003D07FEF1